MMLIAIKDIKDSKILFYDKIKESDIEKLSNNAIVFIENTGFSIISSDKISKLEELGYREHFGTGIFMSVSMLKDLNFKHPYIEGKFIKKDYVDFREKEKYGLESITYKVTEGLKYTFGTELETSDGVIPEYTLKQLSVHSVRDGSLKDNNGIVWGSEIVTDVLKGDSGFRHLQRITSEMSKRCKINSLCGTHFHVGQGDMQPIFSKEHIVYLYQLCLFIQYEVELLLPHSRRNNEYCRRLDSLGINLPEVNKQYSKDEYNQLIAENYDRIVSYLAHSGGYDPKDYRKNHDHPKGFKCGYDHSVPRYCWANFVPTVFNTRKNNIRTFEIRNHGASLNYRKIKRWGLLCIALVHFADNFKEKVNEKITINDILRSVYPRSCEDLISYFNERKEKFIRPDMNEASEYIVEKEPIMKLKEIIYDKV